MLDSAMGQMRVKAAFAAIHAIEGHHPWTHTPAVPLVHTPVASQRTSAFAALEPARHATVSVQRLPYGDDIGAANQVPPAERVV